MNRSKRSTLNIIRKLSLMKTICVGVYFSSEMKKTITGLPLVAIRGDLFFFVREHSNYSLVLAMNCS